MPIKKLMSELDENDLDQNSSAGSPFQQWLLRNNVQNTNGMMSVDPNQIPHSVSDQNSMNLPAPQSQKQPSWQDYMVSPEEREGALEKKRQLGLLGFIGDNLANRTSTGSIMLGRQLPHQDVSGLAKSMSDNVDQGLKDKQQNMEDLLNKPVYQYVAQRRDPNSELSNSMRGLYTAKLQSLKNSELFKNNPSGQKSLDSLLNGLSGMSDYEMENSIGNSGLLKMMNQEEISSLKNDILKKSLEQRERKHQDTVDIAKERLNLRIDDQAASAASTFDKDQILTTLTQQQQQIRRDKHTLESAEILTPQLFNEINLGIANAISGGKSAAVTTQGKVEYESLELAMKNLQQKISNTPQDIGSPEVKQYIAGVLNRLDDAYQNNMKERASQISIGKSYNNNSLAQDAVRKKVDSYSQGSTSDSKFSEKDSLSDKDKEALEWAKSNRNDPRSIKILIKLNDKIKGGT